MTTRRCIPILALGLATWPMGVAVSADKPEAPTAPKRPAPARPDALAGLFKLVPLGVADIPSLAGDELVEIDGQTMTVATLRARMASARKEAETRLEERRARFEEAEQARRFAANAAALAAIDHVRANPSPALSSDRQRALVDEARQLVERYRTAGEKDREEIERQAGEVLKALLPESRP